MFPTLKLSLCQKFSMNLSNFRCWKNKLVMRRKDLLLCTVTLTVMSQTCYLQHLDSLNQLKKNDPTSEKAVRPNMFRLFTGSVNALYSGDEAKGGMDLSVQTYHYYLVTGKRPLKDSTQLRTTSQTSLQHQYNGFEFFLLNRAALDFDTSRSLANDYITSLQASPITIRFMKEIFLTQQRSISSNSYSPVVSIQLTGDGRAIPYENIRNQVNVGASGHLYLTFSTQFTRLEFDHIGKEIDRGTMYLQPSIGIAFGNGEMMKSVYVDQKNKPLLSSECRLGFKSHAKTVNDCSLLVRYAISDVVGPKLRAGIILSSFN